MSVFTDFRHQRKKFINVKYVAKIYELLEDGKGSTVVMSVVLLQDEGRKLKQGLRYQIKLKTGHSQKIQHI